MIESHLENLVSKKVIIFLQTELALRRIIQGKSIQY